MSPQCNAPPRATEAPVGTGLHHFYLSSAFPPTSQQVPWAERNGTSSKNKTKKTNQAAGSDRGMLPGPAGPLCLQSAGSGAHAAP